jgi:hypothetical protein
LKTKLAQRSGRAAHGLSDGDLWATGTSIRTARLQFRHALPCDLAKLQSPRTGIHYSSWHTLFLIVAEMIQYFPHSNINAAARQAVDIQRFCAADVSFSSQLQ